MDEIKVMLFDNARLFREGIKKVLEHDQSIRVVATGDEKSNLPRMLYTYDPDILILDSEIIWNNQLDVEKDIMQYNPETKLAIFSSGHEEDFVPGHLDKGVSGYMLKTMSRIGFIDAVKTMYDGKCYIHPFFSDSLVRLYLALFSEQKDMQ